jgi:glycosyltransferase involved in cell wall biosynthesis
MGKATVATRVGAEGLDVQHERDILLEDDPASFADAIVNLLGDVNLRRKYEAAAAATARQYDWSVIAAQFVRVLEKMIRMASDARVVSPQIEPVSVS